MTGNGRLVNVESWLGRKSALGVGWEGVKLLGTSLPEVTESKRSIRIMNDPVGKVSWTEEESLEMGYSRFEFST